MSPFLFSIFLADIEAHLQENIMMALIWNNYNYICCFLQMTQFCFQKLVKVCNIILIIQKHIVKSGI